MMVECCNVMPRIFRGSLQFPIEEEEGWSWSGKGASSVLVAAFLQEEVQQFPAMAPSRAVMIYCSHNSLIQCLSSSIRQMEFRK
jgi:hypothetical protein